MKALTTYFILSFLIFLSAASASAAQDEAASAVAAAWSQFSPEGEAFTVMMPQQNPSSTPQAFHLDRINLSGTLYSVKSENALYRIWSLNDAARSADPSLIDQDAYLDACAELFWDVMLKADRERIEKSRDKFAYMHYRRELQAGATPGREYSLTLDTTMGLVHFYNDRGRVYFLVVTSPVFISEQNEQFLKSFTLANQKPATADAAAPTLFPPDNRPIPYGYPPQAGSAGAGTGTNNNNPAAAPAGVDYSRTFSPREVTQKARIRSKPEPQYTEAARRFAVSGTVVLRAILSVTGEVTNIRVITKLPHGLTGRSIAAARQIRFDPAQKDGHTVSQYIQIEYNYNLF